METILRQVPAPEFSPALDNKPEVPEEEYARRLDALQQAAGTDWVVVFGDREHFANLAYLLNFDPRFEEALLVLNRRGRRVQGLKEGTRSRTPARIAPRRNR